MARVVDMDFDQNLGNPPRPECYLNFVRDQDFVVATEAALPWEEPADGDDGRCVVPVVWVESLLRRMEVTNLEDIRPIPYFTSCLSLNALTEGLNALLELGLVDAEDGDSSAVRDFVDRTELQRRADELVTQFRGSDPRLQVGAADWDTFEPLGAGSAFAWLDELSVAALAERSGTLEAYVELSKTLGFRALEAQRNQPEEQVMVMAGGPMAGGQLLALLKGYYLSPAQAAIAVSPYLGLAQVFFGVQANFIIIILEVAGKFLVIFFHFECLVPLYHHIKKLEFGSTTHDLVVLP